MHELVILIAKYGLAVPLIGYAFLAYYRRRELRQLLVFTVVSAVITLVLIKIATTIHSDPRPFIRDGVTPYFTSSTDNGFPSDHTALAAAIAAIVFRFKKWAGLALFTVAGLIGAARVAAGVHHGQDVIGSMLLACLAVALGSYASLFILKKLPKTTSEA